ncbi:MAG: bifunctional phosphoribosylaminoimidazolecarboxamide formyltransferase/IMP cyclohydrolase [Phycisphaerales bacterium]|nr:bifunctional phosphoribosylaminoimidazolecarboxamide formyltransferase/IMP cyclohydrolase [Phycisphaerales bacterium]
MPDLVQIKRALLSVSDKTDLVPFAQMLVALGVEIISTGGTGRALAQAGISVVSVDDVTGFPEIMDGRVKTLHPLIHGGLLARRQLDEHQAALDEHGITPIDLVCVNLYPFERTIRAENVTTEQAIEQIDIGGPSMIRSAAKNHEWITVVTDPRQYDHIVNQLRQHDGSTTLQLRAELAAAAFSRTAEYDAAISAYMNRVQAAAFPDTLRLTYTKAGELRYGENPHLTAALYRDPASVGATVVHGDQLHGKPLSFNNIADAAAALELVHELEKVHPGRACACVVKHTNPCGAAVADDLADAFVRAYEGDPMAAYGGILAMSATVDASTAGRIVEGTGRFLEVIVAPGFDDEALAKLKARWANVRLLAVGRSAPSAHRKLDYRSVPGGILVQDRDLRSVPPEQWKHAAGPVPSEDQLADAMTIWTICKHLKSNAIAIGCDHQLWGAGAGQMDRVTAARLAVEKAANRLGQGGGAIAASDAFFPFKDGPQALIEAGVTLLVQPGGSKRDQETLDLCEQRGVTCMLTGTRHFKH